MFNQFSQQLKQWYPHRDRQQWVLGTLYQIDGPSYRSPGAMMLFNDAGEQLGLLSGGCLEADIQKKASQVMRSQRSMTLCYDASDDGDMAFLLGIGCGGTLHILLQPLTAANHYLQLPVILDALAHRQRCLFVQKITEQGELAEADVWRQDSHNFSAMAAQLGPKNALLTELHNHRWLVTAVKPPLHLLVVGGGIDARPLASLAATLGWEVTLCDPRAANARREHFMRVSRILRCPPSGLIDEPLFEHFDAAIVMTHNLQQDADAVAALQSSAVKYLGLLGPIVRKKQVLALAGLNENTLSVPIAGPAGLRLGGELPEDIALSIIAECQAVVHRKDAQSISQRL
ncbi:MAG: XdhC family protein [Porticoccaceae bacterium]|nr:XdhC family protein [Porticoccaceae bacterium]